MEPYNKIVTRTMQLRRLQVNSFACYWMIVILTITRELLLEIIPTTLHWRLDKLPNICHIVTYIRKVCHLVTYIHGQKGNTKILKSFCDLFLQPYFMFSLGDGVDNTSCHVTVAFISAVGHLLWQASYLIRRLAKTLLGDHERHYCSHCTRAC